MLSSFLTDLYNIVYALIVDIPVDNLWGVVYVVLNTVVSFILAIFGYSGNGGIFSSY